jgi:hypothetical protein
MLNSYDKQRILSYGANLRTLKIKMDEKNIKYLFKNDEDVFQYLYDKESTFTTTQGEGIYLCTVRLLNQENINMDNIFNELQKYYKKLNIDVSYEYYKFILSIIIENYNDYYLNDTYYYNGYWDDGNWKNYE